jgi:hypothetical protein
MVQADKGAPLFRSLQTKVALTYIVVIAGC